MPGFRMNREMIFRRVRSAGCDCLPPVTIIWCSTPATSVGLTILPASAAAVPAVSSTYGVERIERVLDWQRMLDVVVLLEMRDALSVEQVTQCALDRNALARGVKEHAHDDVLNLVLLVLRHRLSMLGGRGGP